jgi:hypothetical protein
MRKKLKIYGADYSELCRFKYEFERFESNMILLRENVFNWLDKKDDKEIADIETMIKVEMSEINRVSVSISSLPLITFILGIMAALYKESGMTYLFLWFSLFILIILGVLITKSDKYNKYYTFLQDMIRRYKEEKQNKI